MESGFAPSARPGMTVLSQFPHLAGRQGAEALLRDAGLAARFGKRLQRRVERLFGELERAVVMAEREFGAAVEQGADGLLWVHVLVLHEPARLVGADRQDHQPERPMPLTRRAKVVPIAITGIADVIDAA